MDENDVVTRKAHLRASLLRQRRDLDDATYASLNYGLLERLKSLPLPAPGSHIHTYLCVHAEREPDPQGYLDWLAEQGLSLQFYTWGDPVDGHAQTVTFQPGGGLRESPTGLPKGVPVPVEGRAVAAGLSYDLILVPLVGFDKNGNRLGRGTGWYDRWLAGQPHARVIGLGFEINKVPEIPHLAHDRRVGTIVTESQIYHVD